jgi:hypothetical protein
MKAFPRADGRHDSSKPDEQGMDLRDYFAAKALPAIYEAYADKALTEGWEVDWPSRVASTSYKIADEMIKERKRTGE